jgi:hypothetical protein
MLTLEKEVVVICIGKTLQQIFVVVFFSRYKPKPKHRALILFGLFLM